MSKVIVVVGFGPGISNAVAHRFGAEGFKVALVARNQERLEAGVKALREKGIEAAAFAADASDASSIAGAIDAARKELGPIAALQWNAYGTGAGDLLTASSEELRGIFDVAVVGLTAAVQAALPDLQATKGSVLVTNGGFGFNDRAVDETVVGWNVMGLGLANAAKRKLVGLLSVKLGGLGVYVGEVVVTGLVKGTAFDTGNATLEPATIADAFWKLQAQRTETSVTV